MRKFTVILAGLLCLAACHSQDKLDVKPATLEVKVDKVGATKATFSVTSSRPDATYIYLGVGAWEDDWYSWSDQEIAQEYLNRLVKMDQDEKIQKTVVANFQDRFCFKGSRSFRFQFMAKDMDYRVIVAQVDPEKKALVGNAVSAFFHTQDIPAVNVDFEASLDGDILSITPTDNTVAYYWDYESLGYFWGDLASAVYYYLYMVTDMYEEYGFIDQVVSKGPVSYNLAEEDKGMVDGDITIVFATAYANHEMATNPSIWAFEYHQAPGKSILRAVDAPVTKAPAPLQPVQWQEHHSRRIR